MDEHYLDAQKIKIKRREGVLILKMDGQCLKLAPPKRAIPLSAPDEFIVLSDEHSHEIGVLRRLDDLEPDSRELLGDELYQRYRATIIERVLSIKRDPISGLIRWAVEVEQDDDGDEPQLPMGIKPSLGLRLLRKTRAKSENDQSDGADLDASHAGDDVTTGREVVFHIAGNEDVQNARYPRIFITDTNGRRYEVPNCEHLDLASRRMCERYF